MIDLFIPYRVFIKLDHLLRNTLFAELQQVLAFIYKIDVFLTVSVVAAKKDWTYATALPREEYITEVEDCRHPLSAMVLVTLPVSQGDQIWCFLQGLNMAGKIYFHEIVWHSCLHGTYGISGRRKAVCAFPLNEALFLP